MNGKQLRELRQKTGMTQQAFGKALGYSRTPIVEHELQPRTPLSPRMELAVEALSLRLAVKFNDPAIARPNVVQLARQLLTTEVPIERQFSDA